MTIQTLGTAFIKAFKSKWVIGGCAVLVIGGSAFFVTHRGKSSPQVITVTKGSITQTVSVTGNTTPMQNLSLGFQNSGTIAHVNYQLGDTVHAGDVIAQLNMASLAAALQQAQANVAVQQAQLDGLKAGAQPEDIATSQAALQLAQQNLANLYASISDASISAYTKANDATRTQLNPLFSNAETINPQLTYDTANQQAAINAIALRLSASNELNAWQNELTSISPSSSSQMLAALLTSDVAHLTVIQHLLNAVSTTLDGSMNLDATDLAAYKASVTTGLTEVNTAISSLNTISQNIAAQQATVAQAQAQLALKQAGSTPQTIAAQEAQVAVAQAGVASAEANLRNAEIIAPIDGILTQQDAKVGQQATANTPLVSIIGNNGFEVDAGVSETDVGKLAIGDQTTMTLDAFPGETFTGRVFYIAPAQTDTGGVITYLIKVSFDKADPRIKSGLTANLTIQTNHQDHVLILPQYAILQNDQGTFVEVRENKTIKQIPVTLGIQDQNGNVEVLSGVSDGEQVLNIGLKTQ